ncbi:MAG: T9SS type A sorting domain-containing protein [Oculatellaceae cyanobacterium Prado106]|jgi:hypothetical protein|nr:T9SS type A sorting domain-containing protein [Oculatellaceae cyanobacterium Prado106]
MAFRDLAGNTLKTALDLGSPQTARDRNVINAFVGQDDSNDFYRIRLRSASNVALTLRSLPFQNLLGNADIQLLNRQGRVLADGQLNAQGRDRIQTNLPSGTYFIRVFPQQGNIRYRLISVIARSPASN